jgi:DNA-binding CsgD family transcriptional regulator
MLPELGDTSQLTPRQRDIVDLMRKGLSDREIAQVLGVGLETVKSHMENLRYHFDAVSKADLVCQFWIHGILERPRMIAIAAFFLCALSTMPQGRVSIRAPQGRPKVAQVMRINRQEISGVIA